MNRDPNSTSASSLTFSNKWLVVGGAIADATETSLLPCFPKGAAVNPFLRWSVLATCTLLLGFVSSCAQSSKKLTVVTAPAGSGEASAPAAFPDFMPDPLEPLNRRLWALNEGLLLGFMQPTSRVYRKAVPLPVRTSIKNFTRNVTYPGRLVNHALQGRWSGAGDESLRFLANSTAGVGGLFDVASRWKIPKSNADFGQTFTRWGWSPNAYIMIPFFGPSDDCHAFGLALDKAAEPWNYTFPYIYASYVSTYDGATDLTEAAAQFARAESDPYVGVKYAWTYQSKDKAPDWSAGKERDVSTLQTLAVALIQCRDPKFIERERELTVRMPTTGRDTKCSYWLQPAKAPLVFVAPGLGAHRLSAPTLSLAESLYQNGYSVVTTTGVFHPEFIEQSGTTNLPGYPPADCQDMLVEFTEFDRQLKKKYPGRFGERALVGFSMGGFQALWLAAHQHPNNANMIQFERYVAINPPVNLRKSKAVLDGFYDAPKHWSADQRQARINNALHKVAMIGKLPPELAANPPFETAESEFLVGLSFRLTLRDAIYSTQLKHNMGVLKNPLSRWRRESSYREIFNFSFTDYYNQFVTPYYRTKGVREQDFLREEDLRSCSKALRSQSNVRAVVNRNDFLLTSGDTAWLQSTFGSERLKVFPDGGHLGNLATQPFQKAVIEALAGLK